MLVDKPAAGLLAVAERLERGFVGEWCELSFLVLEGYPEAVVVAADDVEASASGGVREEPGVLVGEPTAGGLASTVFAPITAALAAHFSWRTTYAILAAILALITVPAHALALRAPRPPPPEPPTHATSSNKQDTVALSRSFLLLAAAFALSGFAVYAVVIGLVPLLTERGASSTTAAWALGRGGAGQTLGRTL